MATRSVISVDKKTEEGIYKHNDEGPYSTIPPILTYIAIYGFIAFKKEILKIAEKGGCKTFYYVYDNNEFRGMLESGQLGLEIYNDNFHMENIRDQLYGYLVSNNEIKIYKNGSLEKTLKFNIKIIKKLTIEGIFNNNIEETFTEFFKLKSEFFNLE